LRNINTNSFKWSCCLAQVDYINRTRTNDQDKLCRISSFFVCITWLFYAQVGSVMHTWFFYL
jgi:hypothetical protein